MSKNLTRAHWQGCSIPTHFPSKAYVASTICRSIRRKMSVGSDCATSPSCQAAAVGPAIPLRSFAAKAASALSLQWPVTLTADPSKACRQSGRPAAIKN